MDHLPLTFAAFLVAALAALLAVAAWLNALRRPGLTAALITTGTALVGGLLTVAASDSNYRAGENFIGGTAICCIAAALLNYLALKIGQALSTRF